jgi:hypothetical protein
MLTVRPAPWMVAWHFRIANQIITCASVSRAEALG